MNTFRVMRIVLILAIAMSLAACGYNKDGGRVETNGVGTLNTDRAEHQLGTTNVNMHQNTRVEMSQELADRIADMVEVDRASVLVTNENAYIAVVLADEADEGIINDLGTDGTHNKMEMTRTRGVTDKTRINNKEDITRVNNNKEIKGTQDKNLHVNRNANRDDNRLDKTRMKRQFNEAQDVTSVLKDKITKEVKRHAPHVLDVYISANPDFGDRMNGFIDQIQAGHPVRGFINEVNTTFERMFPTNSGPDISPNTVR